MKRFLDCFNYKDINLKYHYLGYVYPPFLKNNEPYNICVDLIKWVDDKVRPWWAPLWFMNLLHLWGNDNSIIRVRNRFIHNLKNWIINYFMFTDFKTKYGTMRIYYHGAAKEVAKEIDRIEHSLDKYCEEY